MFRQIDLSHCSCACPSSNEANFEAMKSQTGKSRRNRLGYNAYSGRLESSPQLDSNSNYPARMRNQPSSLFNSLSNEFDELGSATENAIENHNYEAFILILVFIAFIVASIILYKNFDKIASVCCTPKPDAEHLLKGNNDFSGAHISSDNRVMGNAFYNCSNLAMDGVERVNESLKSSKGINPNKKPNKNNEIRNPEYSRQNSTNPTAPSMEYII